MLSGLSKFKQLRHFAASALVLMLLAGCATTGDRPMARRPAPAQPLDKLQVATLPPERDEMAQLLEGDFALADTDLKSAAAAYGRAAAVSDNPKVAERAVGLALAIHDSAAAETGIARWQAVGGKPAELAQARAQLALDRGQGAEAQRQLESLVGSGDKDAWRNFGRVWFARDRPGGAPAETTPRLMLAQRRVAGWRGANREQRPNAPIPRRSGRLRWLAS